MNIQKQLKTGTIISMLITGLIFAPTSAVADRHHQKAKSHSNSTQQQYSNARSHSKYKTQRNSYGKKHRGYNRQNLHRAPSYNVHGYNPHNGHNQVRHSYSPYYSLPWYINPRFIHNGGFSIGYQDENFGFTIRD